MSTTIAAPSGAMNIFPHLEVLRMPESPLEYFDAAYHLGGIMKYLEVMTFIGLLQGTITIVVTSEFAVITANSLTLKNDPLPTPEQARLLETTVNEILRRAKVLVGKDIKAELRCTYLPS